MRKIAEENLKKAKAEAENASKAKSVFLTNMSHELRTPLVGILGFSELLEAQLNNDELKNTANLIHASGERLLDTLNSILDLSVIEANKLDINIEPVDVYSILTEVKNLYEASALKKNLYFKFYFKENRIIAKADERLLRQTLNNLVNNAIKYTKSGGITVTVYKESEEWITINVTDTGIGISEQFQKIVFEPFRQASEGFSRTYQGTGLGLSIAKKFTESMGGIISVKSEKGIGSTFTLKIPASAEIELSISSGIKTVQTHEKHLLSDIKPTESVLLIEDDEISQQLVISFIKSRLHLDIASTGEEAIKFCKEKSYSLILMDISLGGNMSGIEAMKLVKEISGYADIPIAALTAHTMSGQKEELLSIGFTHYLSKPFSQKQLWDLFAEMKEK
jgi:CheY-like chemotaxis protein